MEIWYATSGPGFILEDKEIQEAVAGDEEDERAVGGLGDRDIACIDQLLSSKFCDFSNAIYTPQMANQQPTRRHPKNSSFARKLYMGWLEGPRATARAGAIFTGRLTTVADKSEESSRTNL